MRDYQDFFMKKLPAMQGNFKGRYSSFIRFCPVTGLVVKGFLRCPMLRLPVAY